MRAVNQRVRVREFCAFGAAAITLALVGYMPALQSVANAAAAPGLAPVQSAPMRPVTAAPGQTGAAPASPQTAQAGEPTRQTFGDWGIACVTQSGAQICSLAQELRRSEDKAMVVLMEVRPVASQRAEAGLTLPFGLQFAAGVDLAVDGQLIARRQAFLTCTPQGCLVPLSFDAAALLALQRGQVLSLRAATPSGGKVELELSLRGFDAAYARMEDLFSGKASLQ